MRGTAVVRVSPAGLRRLRALAPARAEAADRAPRKTDKAGWMRVTIPIESVDHGIETGQHAASLTGGRPGVLHGNLTYLLQDAEGQITDAHSISAALDSPGLGPEHSLPMAAARPDSVPPTHRPTLAPLPLPRHPASAPSLRPPPFRSEAGP